jgi:hypothetical protein
MNRLKQLLLKMLSRFNGPAPISPPVNRKERRVRQSLARRRKTINESEGDYL